MMIQRRIQTGARWLVMTLMLDVCVHPIVAQEKSREPLPETMATVPARAYGQPPTPAPAAKRPITLSDAVSIFLQQNLQLVAARYDVDSADAEKLTARLRPNPQLTIGSSGLPLNFSGPFISQQTFSYGISQTLELGGKRRNAIEAANANSDLAEGEFQMV